MSVINLNYYLACNEPSMMLAVVQKSKGPSSSYAKYFASHSICPATENRRAKDSDPDSRPAGATP